MGFFYIVYQQINYLLCLAFRQKVQFDSTKKYPFEEQIKILFIYRLRIGNDKTQWINSFHKDCQGLPVCIRVISNLDILSDQPIIIINPCAPKIRKLIRKCIDIHQVFNIFHSIEWFHIKPFVRFPNKFFIKISAFQIGIDFIHPFPGGYRRKLIK